jgi:hypothetical protein
LFYTAAKSALVFFPEAFQRKRWGLLTGLVGVLLSRVPARAGEGKIDVKALEKSLEKALTNGKSHPCRHFEKWPGSVRTDELNCMT